MEVPQIYCVNLPTSKERRKRMEDRFRHHGLLDKVTFVDGVHYDCGLVDYYDHKDNDPINNKLVWKKSVGCHIGHLNALRKFLQTKDKYCLVCEDDILLHNNFAEKFADVMANIPPGTPLVSFFYMNEKWECPPAGLDPNKRNVIKINPRYTWGAQCYYITQEYAIQVLLAMDRPICETNYTFVGPENFIKSSGGLMSYPPLVIEDCIDSDRNIADTSFHMKHCLFWGYKNYDQCDQGNLSPLALVKAD